jgi:GNAT superfamily N-acetyltransferase
VNTLITRFHDTPHAGLDPARAPTLRQGTAADYAHLARFHYRPARPATIVRVLALDAADEPVAVLVVSMPTLNAPWRAVALPDLFATRDKRCAAANANAHLRTISRLIVDPRWRGLGLATRLVRTYLRDPLTPVTEALAAMAHYCPVFDAAGMTAVTVPQARHEARLHAALAAAGLQPWQLLWFRQGQPCANLSAALRTWARASRATRALAEGPLPIIAQRAAAALSGARIAYICGRVPGAASAPSRPQCLDPPMSF